MNGRIRLFAGKHPDIMAVYSKPVPACNFAQTASQAALLLALPICNLADVVAITVRVPDAAIRYPGCDSAGPFQHALQAKMSIRFSVAATFALGTIEEENYSHLGDPTIIGLVDLIDLKSDADLTAAFPDAQGAEIVVRLHGGATLQQRHDDVVAATPQEIRARFHRAAAATMGLNRADELEGLVDICESLSDGSAIAACCRLELSRAPGSKKKAGLDSAPGAEHTRPPPR